MRGGVRLVGMAAVLCLSVACTATGSPGETIGSAEPSACADVDELHCDLITRFQAANTFLESRPGTTGFVLRDRATGFAYRNDFADDAVATASTIKLAMVTDLLIRAREGSMILSPDDWELMEAMLYSSDDVAADILWERYSGDDGWEFDRRFTQFGMTSLRPQHGEEFLPYWGAHLCTPNDLDNLMQFVLTSLDPADRDFIVSRMQNIAPNQQWGVWSAGADQSPGNKAGWSEEQSGWVINSVGFSGAGQRYTLAVMNSLSGVGGYDEGVETISTVARILLGGLDKTA